MKELKVDHIKQYACSSQVGVLSDCQLSEIVNKVTNAERTAEVFPSLIFSFS